MRTWVLGNKAAIGVRYPRRTTGFTLLELLLVISIIALASAVVSLALPDPATTRLEREGDRLVTLLEAARVESRARGVPVLWVPGAGPVPGGSEPAGDDFHFPGLPASADLPTHWLQRGIDAPVAELPPQRRGLVLGPEPVIGPQRLVLRAGERQLVIATDGWAPFKVMSDAAAPR